MSAAVQPVVIPSQGVLRTTQHTNLAKLVLGKTSRRHAHVWLTADACFPPSPKDSLEKFALRNYRTTTTKSSGAGIRIQEAAVQKTKGDCRACNNLEIPHHRHDALQDVNFNA